MTLTAVAPDAGKARLGTPSQASTTIGDDDYTVTVSVDARDAGGRGRG